MIKNPFYFTSKDLFVLKIFKFLSWIFVLVAKRLDKKDQVSLKFYDVTVWLTKTIVIHIMPNISKSKGNQTMKFGQLIECNMRNIFLEKSYTKCGGETSPRLFSEKLKLSILLDKYTACFYCIPSWGLSKYVETKFQATCFYLIVSFFKK